MSNERFRRKCIELRKLVASLNLGGNGGVHDVSIQTNAAVKSHIITQTKDGPRLEHSRYSFRGSDGVERTYNSLDEMPPDVRKMFEAMNRETPR